ncbi:MAG TPA: YgiT-type zinc finger protein [Clostridia bacterium]|nr:YgiT-type zinc finger protein [Clostridia bacterium]
MQLIKCLFCGKPTTLHKINAQKRIKGKIITLAGAPVYYCAPCKETFLSKETQDVFRYIQDRSLEEKGILYQFDDIMVRIKKSV